MISTLRRTPAAAILLLLVACSNPAAESAPVEPVPADTTPTTAVAHRPAARADEARPTRRLDPALQRVQWVEAELAGMSLHQKVAQMIMPSVLGTYAPKGSAEHERLREWVEEYEVGGFVMSVGSPMGVALKLNDLQSHSRLPLLVAGDYESGVGFRLSGILHASTDISLGGATNFPTLMALGAVNDAGLAYRMGRITAEEARAVGVHVAFAPVLDVNNNPENPIINVRSLGEDPDMVSRLGTALVRGMEEHGMIATGKHFPGHGDTDTDSHIGLPTITVDRARMDSVELRPFRNAIEAGMTGVMTAHITVPSINGGTIRPATLSAPVLTGLLRGELGFNGLLFTDAMDMGAIDREYGRDEAVILAVEAGADVLLMPPSVPDAIDAVVGAVLTGRIPEDRLDASVRRILTQKYRLGLVEDRMVEINAVQEMVGIPAHIEVAAEIAQRSITVLRNELDLLPLLGTRTARVTSVTYRRNNDLFAGRYFDAEMRARYPRLRSETVSRDTPVSTWEALLRDARRSDLVVVSLHITALSYQGTVALPKETIDFINGLVEAGIPHVVISFGNPYLLREIEDVQAYALAWSGSEVSQRAAAGALFGDFAIEGRAPTRVTEDLPIGSGLTIPARGNGR
ncbi:MAG: glycoside hydrolase family 3 N-terminal domain-containing protein [Longimicrobiales bacterium]|nr:glycoside hydrolase family 3 N-terminal domain-containing protein [Longimicrobiales bacterium]